MRTNCVRCAYPDTLVGTDSHTTMINGLGVLGWGVGGIEAEAAMLGQPVSMLIPEVVGFKLHGKLPEGATATDLVLTVTEMLRKKGVVGKFVEFYRRRPGGAAAGRPRHHRQHGARVRRDLRHLPGRRRDAALPALHAAGRKSRSQLVEAYTKEQGLFHTRDDAGGRLQRHARTGPGHGRAEPGRAEAAAGSRAADRREEVLADGAARPAEQGASRRTERPVAAERRGEDRHRRRVRSELQHGSVVIAAITSCTNTSNPSVMMAAGLLAKKAVERGLTDQAVGQDEPGAGVEGGDGLPDRSRLDAVAGEAAVSTWSGYGCTTCIGNSGPLPPPVSQGVEEKHLVVAAVLSGNRNFEGRVHPEVRANYLASPPLVVAYALAGRMDIDLHNEPLGTGSDGKPVFLRDVWPTQQEVNDAIAAIGAFRDVREGIRRGLPGRRATGKRCRSRKAICIAWDPNSTYVKHPPYFEGMKPQPEPVTDVHGRPRAGGAGRQHHDRPHLAGRLDQDGRARPAST